ncbi:MAG: alpha/beta fold hydrolase [Polyangiales bacterium]
MKPFAQRPYHELPEHPRLPHDYDRCEAEDVTLDSAPFGRIRVHVRSIGSGPPLLLVHGLMTSSYSWRYVYAPLAERFRVIAPDLVGCGRTEAKPDHPHSARALATFLGELQKTLGIEGCAAVGNSLGGYLCLQRAIADERAFSKLVVVHAPAFPELRIRALHTLLALPGSRAALRWAIHRDPMKWAFRNVHYRDESLKSRQEAREYGAPLSTPEGAADFARWLHDAVDPTELAAFGEALRLRAPEIPILLLYAREDPMVPPSVGPRLAELLPRARFEWMEGTSHFAHVDTPSLVLERMLPFLT